MTNDKTLVIITGGTIEALYSPEEGTPYYVPLPDSVEKTAIPEAMKKLGVDGDVEFMLLSMEDSKNVWTPHLDHIAAKVGPSDYKRVVIVHGTDTMPLHARYLKRRLQEWEKDIGRTVVLTGAMYPLRDKQGQWRYPETVTEMNDGWENLRRAMEDVRTVPHGVYIEMGKGPWEADTVTKHVETENARPDTKVKHSEFRRMDPERYKDKPF